MGAEPITDERVQIHPGDLPSASLRTADGRWVRIHSGRDPVAEADRFVESAIGTLPGGAPAVIVVIGPGLGYIVEAIERRAPETKIVAVEPFAALAQAFLARRDWRPRLESRRLAVVVGPEYGGVAAAARLIDARSAASTTVIAHPVVAREFPEEVAAARTAIARILEGARLNAEARRAFAGRYLLNTLRNLPALLEEGDVARLRGAFAGIPAVVVAAGPSLDDNLPHIRRLADRALIIAVDTTLRPLRAAGVRPHLVVGVDPSELNARHLLGLDETDGSFLVAEGSLDPRVFPEFAGRVFAFKVSDHQPWPWLAQHGFDRGTLRAWGSVLTTAFDLAIEAGCEPIAFAGADLSYTGGLHYARGTMNEDEGYADADASVRAEGFAEATRVHGRTVTETLDIHGRSTTSTAQFLQFRDWLTARAAEAAPRRVVNATGAGTLFGGGIVQADFAELEIDAPAFDLYERLALAWRAARDEQARAARTVTSVFMSPRTEALPMSSWIDFGGDSINEADVVAALEDTWRRAPVVTQPPSDVVRLAGRPVRLRAQGSGGPPPHVQWQESRDGGRTWDEIAGARERTLMFPLAPEHHGRQFRAVFTNTHGSAASAPATVRVRPRAVRGDFDGDGQPELLWRHWATGNTVVWHLDGTAFTGASQVNPIEPDMDWTVAATADFSGNGGVDLLWRNLKTGAQRIWLMDGLVRVAEIGLLREPDAQWRITGAGRVTGGESVEVVWHHRDTGAMRIWAINEALRPEVRSLPGEPDVAWQAVAVADLDDDGRDEVLWRHAATGAMRAWRMDGDVRDETVELAAEPDPGWLLVAVQDFTGDGGLDLLWRNPHTGENRVWLMDGFARTAVRSFSPATLEIVSPDWLVSPEYAQMEAAPEARP